MPAMYLCRFVEEEEAPHLGLVAGDFVYDLTDTDDAQPYASLGDWLRSTVDRSRGDVMSELARVPTLEGPAFSVADLEDPDEFPFLVKPIDEQEIWACGVTYRMSREARMRESGEPTLYGRVYDAERPEVFFKGNARRTVTSGRQVGIREDSEWDVPEAELTVLLAPDGEIWGYAVGNDMSSRDIESQNPLYLTQAKVYNRSCALGPMIRVASDYDVMGKEVRCTIAREEEVVFQGRTTTAEMKRSLRDLARYLFRCNSFPNGVFMMTGTGIVPPDSFTLQDGDTVRIEIEGIGTLTNSVVTVPA